jgi:hypothetical protein
MNLTNENLKRNREENNVDTNVNTAGLLILTGIKTSIRVVNLY